jgi:glycogen operon protein
MGAEGPTDDPEIIKARERQKRNLLATLVLSQGVPMILGGDEIGRTQRGNNNAYCQDNEISWTDWKLDERKEKLLEFTTKLIELRKAHPNLRRRKFFQDRAVRHSEFKDIAWYRTDGQEMTDEEWNAGWVKSLGVMYNGKTLDSVDEMGQPVLDDSFLVLLNSSHEGVTYTLPSGPHEQGWEKVLDTSELEDPFKGGETNGSLEVYPRSVVLLRERNE